MAGLQVLSVGGEVLGRQFLSPAVMEWLRCGHSGELYRMGLEPVALALGPLGATVLAGFVEVCPLCHFEHVAGVVLPVELV